MSYLSNKRNPLFEKPINANLQTDEIAASQLKATTKEIEEGKFYRSKTFRIILAVVFFIVIITILSCVLTLTPSGKECIHPSSESVDEIEGGINNFLTSKSLKDFE